MLYFNKSSSKRKGVTFSETKDLKALLRFLLCFCY
jgi:hypothetical protein